VKRKVGTILDEDLYSRVRETARQQGRGLNEILTEALERYLGGQASRVSAVAETRATYRVSARAIRAVLEEDPYDAG
jgi:hypothetical protein